MTEEKSICRTCGRPHPFEDGTMPKHPFNDGTLAMSETFGKKLPDGSRTTPGAPVETAPVSTQWPFDPVLRQALVDKGILTPDDLIEAEKKIRAITAMTATMGVVQ